jgi:hypothetical protein
MGLSKSRFWGKLFYSGKFSRTRTRRGFQRAENYYHNFGFNKFINFFTIGLCLCLPARANTNSSSSSSQGTVINNGYQTITGSFPTHRYSQGIQCQTPVISLNPFITKGENFSLPKAQLTRTNIYDQTKDDNGVLLNPGNILYVSEQERIDQTTHSFNYGVTLNIQVPLGKGIDACLAAAKTHRKTQEFMLAAKKLEVNLSRLKICAEQMKLGVKFINEDAVSCKNVVITEKPNQILSHVHPISVSSP